MMTEEDIRIAAKAAYATHSIAEVSNRYTFIPTTRLIEDLKSFGWNVQRARQQRSKNSEYTKHMLVFRNSEEFPAKNGYHLEIITVNSHDRTASFNFMIGIFKLVCSNGLVVADKVFEAFRIRHIHYNFEDIAALVNTMTANMRAIQKVVAKLQNVQMTDAQQNEFAIKAIASRFKEYVNDEGVINVRAIKHAIDLDDFLRATREEDDNASIWSVYNRVQEKLMKGGFHRIGTKDERKKIVRPVTNIKLDVDMNKSLWQLANEYLPN
jgi:hypothetical protein